MNVAVVTAVDSDSILLSVLDLTEDEDTVLNSESGNSVKSLVGEVSVSGLGVVSRVLSNSNNGDLVFTGVLALELEDLGITLNGLVVDNGVAFGTNDCELIVGSSGNGGPGDKVI